MAYVPRKQHLPRAGLESFTFEGPELKDLMCGTEGLLSLGELQAAVGTPETLAAQHEIADALTESAIKRMTWP